MKKTIAGTMVIQPRKVFENDEELRNDLRRLGYGRPQNARYCGGGDYRSPAELATIRATLQKIHS